MHLLTLSYIFFISVTLTRQSSTSVPNAKNATKEVLSASTNPAKSVAVEGGAVPNSSLDKTHASREHVVTNKNVQEVPKVTANVTVPVPSLATNTAVTNLERTPAKSAVVKNGSASSNTSSSNSTRQSLNKTVSTSTTTTTTTTTTELPRKPMKTVHDEIDPMDPSFIKSEVPPPKMSSLDPTLTDKNTRRANYVVPIVAVILSVPLVAFVISILYKRGSDWWQHRNYRRMDYLIEGMYNS